MKWLDSITDSVDANLSKPQEMVKDREAKRKPMGSQSRTRLSDPTTANRWKKRSAGAAFLFSNKDEIRKQTFIFWFPQEDAREPEKKNEIDYALRRLDGQAEWIVICAYNEVLHTALDGSYKQHFELKPDTRVYMIPVRWLHFTTDVWYPSTFFKFIKIYLYLHQEWQNHLTF